MSIQIQLAIPVFVALAALIGIAIFRKYLKPETVIICIAALGFGIFSIISNFPVWVPGQETAINPQQAGDTDNSFSIALAKQYIIDGNYDAAMEVLNSVLLSDGDNSDAKIAAARCSVLTRDYSGAVQFYQNQSGVEDEINDALRLLESTRINNEATIEYLNKNNLDPEDYGFTGNTSSLEFEQVKQGIISTLENDLEEYKNQSGDEASEAVKSVSTITTGFKDFLDTNKEIDESEITNSLKKLAKTVEKNPILKANKHFRLARVKGYVITGQYSQIAKNADRNASSEELVILSHLLVNNMIKKSDFSEEFVDSDSLNKCKEVLKYCQNIIKDQKKDLSSEDYEAYETKVNDLKFKINESVVFTLEQDLLEEIENGDASMKSKCYLALAKLEIKYGNKDKSEIYINEALGTASDSDDLSYRIPMNQMIEIIQGNTDASEIMQVATYVDAAVDHSLPFDIRVSQMPQSDSSENTNGGLNDQMAESVTKSTATVNIGVIETVDFPTVKARIQLDSQKWTSLEEIKEHLNVYDCGSIIKDFTIEKVEFQSSKIILLCDCSGSMSGNEETLRQVIRDFANSMETGEQVSVVCFESSISSVEEFSGDKSVVAGYADKIYAGGGTALYSSLIQCGDMFPQDLNANNIIIAMTDGQDGDWVSTETLQNSIAQMASDKNITVYTIGLGSVDANYLQTMAESGNGSFLYASNSEDLQAFYSFIHGQLKNQYIITFKAKNLTNNERILELSLDDELGGKKKTYYINEPDENNPSAGNSPYVIEDSDITVSGLSTKFLYKSSQDNTVYLKGTGFKSEFDITLRLNGSIKYNLSASYVNETTYEVVIPHSVTTGNYDLEICISDFGKTLENELTVSTFSTPKSYTHGNYTFTALNSYINDNGATVLSGNVMMNGWLRFKGDVTLSTSNYDPTKMQVTDNSGFYVSYSPDMSTGLAKNLAESGFSLYFAPIGTFTISSQQYTSSQYEKFEVEKIWYDKPVSMMFFTHEDFNMSIYPDMLRLQDSNFTFKLPFQEQLIRGFEIIPSEAAKFDSEVLIGSSSIAQICVLEYEYYDNESLNLVSLPLNVKEIKVNIDTLLGNYSIEGAVGFKAFNQSEGLKLSIEVVGGRFESVGLQTLGTQHTLVSAPVPITMSDFGFKLDNFSQYESNNTTLANLFNTDFEILFKVEAASLNKYAPAIAKMIDDKKDIALAELSNCCLKANLSTFTFTFDADMVLATIFEIGNVSISAGNFNYTNELIGLNNIKQSGLRAKATLGWNEVEAPNFSMDLSGSADICLGYPYSGLWFNGKAAAAIHWWFNDVKFDLQGDMMFCAFENTSGDFQLSMLLRGVDTQGEVKGFHAYVTGKDGFDVYTF